MRRKIIVAALLSTFMLGACGVKGQLKTPPPLWGEKAKQQYEDQKKQEEQRSQDQRQDQSQNPDDPDT